MVNLTQFEAFKKLPTVRLNVIETTIGVWFTARTEVDALILRQYGFSPEFDSVTYENCLTVLSDAGYAIETIDV